VGARRRACQGRGVTGTRARRAWIAINLVVGPLVLASYVASAVHWDADVVGALWGAVPEAAQPLYTVNMFVAASGYFVFGWMLLAQRPEDVVVFGRLGFGVFLFAYALILIGSTIWMPLTCFAIAGPSPAPTPWIYVDLWVVAGGSLLLLAALVSLRPRPRRPLRAAAIVGAIFFCLQTVILDGIVWPLYFSL